MTDHDRPGEQGVDDRLRAAGARLRATAPTTDRVGTPRSTGRSGASRRWYVGAGAMAAAAALVAILIVLPRGDEAVRQAPSDTGPTSPTSPTVPDEHDDEPPMTPPTTSERIDDLPAPVVTLVTESSLDDWDGEGGGCMTLQLTEPLEPREIPLCVTGSQLAATAVAYIRGDQYAYGWLARRGPDGELQLARSGGGFVAGGVEYPELEGAPCGPPSHELPLDQWFLVSNCVDGAALYTPLPTEPIADPGGDVLVGAESSTTPLAATPVPTFGASNGPFEVYDLQVTGASELALLDRCVVVAPSGADPWFEMCGFRDEARHNGVFVHDGLPYAVEVVESTRVQPLDPAAVLRTHGCSTPVVDVLDAVADPDGLLGEQSSLVLTGLVCAAAPSPFDNPVVDVSAAASFSGVHLRAGPRDGGLVALGRDGPGPWTITDTGTGIDLEVWPLAIPPAAWFETDPDLLPPIDVTETLRAEIGDAESVEALADAIETYLVGLHEPEAGDPPSVTFVPGLPVREAGEGRPLLVAEVRYLDDSTTSGTYAIWVAEPDIQRPAAIERAYVTNRCSRGVTESEGVLLCT